MRARRLSTAPLVTPAAAGGAFSTMTTTSSPAASNSSNASSSLWASSSMNMVIILATLLCVLIFPLGLYSILRCLLHCARRLSSSSPVPSSASSSYSPAPAGLKRKALRRIPVEVYDADSSAAMAECAICLGEFAGGEKVRVLPRCRHGFHVRCIDAWLAAHSCPNCRASLLVPDAGVGAGAGKEDTRGRR